MPFLPILKFNDLMNDKNTKNAYVLLLKVRKTFAT